MKITVLAGGNSTERDVSIVSGTQVCRALRSIGHQAVLVDVCFGAQEMDPEKAFEGEYDVEAAAAWMRSCSGRLSEIRERRSFLADGLLELCSASDTVFMALHGQNGEDGKIQAAFELLGIRYTGCNYLGSAIAMDKELAKQIFRECGVPTPAGIVVRKRDEIKPADRNSVGLPCVVKPSCGGSSVGVSIARTEEEYRKALEEGFRILQAPESGPCHNCVRTPDARLLQGGHGYENSPFHHPAHPPGLHRRKEGPAVGLSVKDRDPGE